MLVCFPCSTSIEKKKLRFILDVRRGNRYCCRPAVTSLVQKVISDGFPNVSEGLRECRHMTSGDISNVFHFVLSSEELVGRCVCSSRTECEGCRCSLIVGRWNLPSEMVALCPPSLPRSVSWSVKLPQNTAIQTPANAGTPKLDGVAHER